LDTLVVFVTEFGRDHNPKGFTVWLAGAGVKPGFSYGATDEFGYQAVDKVTTIYDLHATLLHLLGLNHERLSSYNNGIERRLTDVHGHVISHILSAELRESAHLSGQPAQRIKSGQAAGQIPWEV
jgi:hypothetical protein